MKKIFTLGAALFFAGATMSAANELNFIGNSEYQFEAKTFELNAGAEYTAGVWTFSGVLNTERVGNADIDFTGATFGATLTANENVNFYGILETDKDFKYEEGTLGVAFRF